MKNENLKQRLSLQMLCESFLSVVKRFPVPICLLVALTVLLSVIVTTDTEPGRFRLCLLAFLTIGTLISLATSLWGEEQANRSKRWGIEILSLILCAVYCVLVFLSDIFPNRELLSFYIGNMAWLVAIIVFIPFASFLREKDDVKTWHFSLSLIAALVISGIVSWVMVGGVEGLLIGIESLFGFNMKSMFPLIILVVGAVLLWGLLFLALIPKGERKHNHSAEMSPLLAKVVSWLLLPLLGCYIVVLYVYGLNILIHWELPKGTLSWLVSAVMIAYLCCYVLLYPQVLNKQSWQSRVLTFYLPIAILPLLVLMTVGVVRRFMDYGITAPRLYLLTLLLWFYAVCIIILAVPRKRFRWIALSFAALFVLTSGQPFNYYRICRPILTEKIDKMFANDALTAEESATLKEDISYMRENYGEKYASRWDKNEETLEKSLIDSNTEKWSITYDNYDYFICPQGFSTFTHKGDCQFVTKESIHEGFLHVDYEDADAVLLFDTAAISKADEAEEPLLISSTNNKVTFSPEEITIKEYEDHTIYVHYGGYFFTKDK